MEGPFRNNFIVDRHTEGVGWDTFTIVATKEDLAALAVSVEQEAVKSGKIVYRYATLAHGKNARVQIAFRSSTKEEVDRLHEIPIPNRAVQAFMLLGFLGIVVLAFVGACSLVK